MIWLYRYRWGLLVALVENVSLFLSLHRAAEVFRVIVEYFCDT